MDESSRKHIHPTIMPADFRSDTVTQPCEKMRQAICTAECGDDVFEEDPTVQKFENLLGEHSGLGAGLFCPTATQGNLVAVLTHCERGEELICGDKHHVFMWEKAGAAVCGGVQTMPLKLDPVTGMMDLAEVEKAIRIENVRKVTEEASARPCP